VEADLLTGILAALIDTLIAACIVGVVRGFRRDWRS
jgi:hypothetical protein